MLPKTMQKYQMQQLPDNYIQKGIQNQKNFNQNTSSNQKANDGNHGGNNNSSLVATMNQSIEFGQTIMTTDREDLIDIQYVDYAEQRNKKYGDLIVLFQSQRLLFTLGPDWTCFIIGYIMLSGLGFFAMWMVHEFTDVWYVNALTFGVFLVHNLSYVYVAMSNPGIETKETIPTDEDFEDASEQGSKEHIKRFCRKCAIRMQRGTAHCRSCNVCVRGYDHHCPWVSKCIGQKNKFKFYFFVGMTMVFIIYSIVALLVCMASGAIQANYQAKRG